MAKIGKIEFSRFSAKYHIFRLYAEDISPIPMKLDLRTFLMISMILVELEVQMFDIRGALPGGQFTRKVPKIPP